jgi:hypothetical protein
MTNNNPITPPPELVEDWIELAKPLPQRPPNPGEFATLAARWGADQELEACCEWINSFQNKFVHAHDLRLVRRRKPPSLKEQALQALAEADLGSTEAEWSQRFDTIRRALEQLDD